MNNCPFCGSDHVAPSYGRHPNGHMFTMICCCDCGAGGPIFPMPQTYSGMDKADEQAEQAWNNRHENNAVG